MQLTFTRRRLSALVVLVAVLAMAAFLAALTDTHNVPAVWSLVQRAAIEIVAFRTAFWT